MNGITAPSAPPFVPDAPHPPRPQLSLRERVRRSTGAFVLDSFFRGVGHGTRYLPALHPRAHGLELIRDVPYLNDGSRFHLLDLYRPRQRSGPLPVILYIHGGGFRFLSKDSHRLFALAFARRGYLVASINYRIAPKDPFPAAHADAFAAYLWVLEHIAEYGGDPTRLAVAGESAGGNLTASLAIATSMRRPEPWARAVFDAGIAPRAVLPACPVLQVSDPERFLRNGPMSSFLHDRVAEVCDAYLGPVFHRSAGELEMADPVCIIERATSWDHPLPPFFVPVGTADPLIDDTRRLEAALHRQGVVCEARYYKYDPHAFHGFVFLPNARRCWRATYDFLARHLPTADSGS